MEDSSKLTLPYEIIDKVANRDYLRKNFKTGNRPSYNIPIDIIEERENFNDRKVFDYIDILMESLIVHGLENPLTVDVLADGRVLLEKGHRRLRAIKMARKKDGNLFELVECYVNSNVVTELERCISIHTSNQYSQELKPFERAENAFKIKHHFGEEKSNEEIGKLLGISRQTVDNLIELASATDDIKNDIRSMPMTAALAFVRSSKKRAKAADKLEEESHISSSAKTSFPKDDLAQEVKDLELLDEQSEEFKNTQQRIEKIAYDKLVENANQVLVNKADLEAQTGKRLAQNAMLKYLENIVDDEGEVISVDAVKIWAKQGSEINDLFIEEILNTDIESVWIFKTITIAESVITQLPEGEEKARFDMDRPEIKAIQGAIQAADKIEAIVSKIDVSEQAKKDISYQVYWLQKNLDEARDWIHRNKKQNKNR